MKQVEPKVYLIGETKINHDELKDFLDEINASDWETEAPSESEGLIEVMGRLCYRSFKPGLNPNVTKVRQGNDVYIKNILSSGHGSVCEHAQLNFIFYNVSRIVTHELVRHRSGTAVSQESLRYVRLDELSTYIPECIKNNEEALTLFIDTVEELEELQTKLSNIYDIDNIKDFHIKKELTSAFRRIAPDGLATTIGWSCNLRALRHILELRTSEGAEEEIRLLFNKVYEKIKDKYPNILSDAKIIPDTTGSLYSIVFENHKI